MSKSLIWALMILTMPLSGGANAGQYEDNLELCLEGASKPDARIAACGWVLQSGQDNGENIAIALNNRGYARFSKKEYGRAIADYTTALRVKPKYARAAKNRGNVWLARGEFEKAIADYTLAIEMNPKYAIAYGNRGIAYEKSGDKVKALEDFKTRYKIGPYARWIVDKLKLYSAHPK